MSPGNGGLSTVRREKGKERGRKEQGKGEKAGMGLPSVTARASGVAGASWGPQKLNPRRGRWTEPIQEAERLRKREQAVLKLRAVSAVVTSGGARWLSWQTHQPCA